jgi:hypothetical protein
MATMLFCGVLYASFRWINWNSAIVFYSPTLHDVTLFEPSIRVPETEIGSYRWLEKQQYAYDTFVDGCKTTKTQMLTNKNLKILSVGVKDSMAFECSTNILYNNLYLEPMKVAKKIVCNETYVGMWRITKRTHPLLYFYNDRKGYIKNKSTATIHATCLMYQTVDILKGLWVPETI